MWLIIKVPDVANSAQGEYVVWEEKVSTDKAPGTPISERQVEENSPLEKETTCRHEGGKQREREHGYQGKRGL